MQFFVYVITLCMVFISGCETIVHQHGHLINEETMGKLKVGESRQEDVTALLGSPTCVLNFAPHTWYYLSENVETRALLAPSVSAVLCYTLEFSSDGRLSHIEKSTKPISIIPSPDFIPLPSDHAEEFLKQVFRNAGRFPAVPRGPAGQRPH